MVVKVHVSAKSQVADQFYQLQEVADGLPAV
jgi:hypothetical protein